jgi:putative aldouronate transport system permease protein
MATIAAKRARTRRAPERATLGQRIWRERWMYLFIIPGAIFFLLFQYLPLLGNIIAFQDFSPFLGIRGSPWVGLTNFRHLLTDPDFKLALTNTIKIEVLQLVFSFPAPLILALVLNSIFSERVKRVMQSVVYLPHFLSWVIIIALWQQILGGAGFVNQLLRNQGLQTLNIMNNPSIFKLLVVAQSIWKEVGWGTIIFLAP